MKAVVFTLGCKVNACESSSLMRGLSEIGYVVSDKLEFADLYILNTCAVTKEAEKKSRQAISRIRAYNKNAKIIVTGCASEHNPESFKNKPGVFLVTGAINKDKILSLINEEGVFIDKDYTYYEKYLPIDGFKTRAYVKVEDGCNNFCSYCLIPYLRGRCRSRSIESVRSELDNISAHEVVITGINLTAYNYDGNDLADLIASLKDYDFRIRLGSLEESVISDKLLASTRTLKDFAPHFHLSLQSGSSKVLKDMNRHYDRNEFIKSIEKVRNVYPNSAITTDIIVGFPTETEEDFLDTLDLCRAVNFADIHCFVYSPREGTKAYDLPRVDKTVCEERMQRLLTVKKQCKINFVNSLKGQTLSVLIEEKKGGYFEGYSENYVRCYLKGENLSGFVNAKVVSYFRDGALCEVSDS